jgi:hypothetical protein
VKRCPNPFNVDSEIEIRQIYEMTDFGELPADIVEKERKLREELLRISS